MSVFITGTDTECGKTYLSTRLLRALAAGGDRVAGMKPVAAGAERVDGRWQNEDAEALFAASTVTLARELHNPYLFEPPCSPHIAAAESGLTIDPAVIAAAYAELAAAADVVVVEGAGGWRVPLGPDLDIAGLARHLGLAVILVVGVRLGCINHALLSAESILGSGLELAGWVANELDEPLYARDAVLATLDRQMPAPCLARLPWRGGADAAALATLCAAARA